MGGSDSADGDDTVIHIVREEKPPFPGSDRELLPDVLLASAATTPASTWPPCRDMAETEPVSYWVPPILPKDTMLRTSFFMKRLFCLPSSVERLPRVVMRLDLS